MQIGPVPLRQDSARPTSRHDSGRSFRPDSGRPPCQPGQPEQPADDQTQAMTDKFYPLQIGHP